MHEYSEVDLSIWSIITALLVSILWLLCVISIKTHSVGMDHLVCMVTENIVTDANVKVTTTCISGEELLKVLRERNNR